MPNTGQDGSAVAVTEKRAPVALPCRCRSMVTSTIRGTTGNAIGPIASGETAASSRLPRLPQSSSSATLQYCSRVGFREHGPVGTNPGAHLEPRELGAEEITDFRRRRTGPITQGLNRAPMRRWIVASLERCVHWLLLVLKQLGTRAKTVRRVSGRTPSVPLPTGPRAPLRE